MHRCRGEGSPYPGFTGTHGFDSLNKDFRRLLLHNNAAGARLHRKEVRFHFINRRENEDLCGSEIAQKLGKKFQAALDSQTYVEQDNVWCVTDSGQSLTGCCCFCNYFDMRLPFNKHANTRANNGVVFYDANTNGSLSRCTLVGRSHNGTSTLISVLLSQLEISERAPRASARSIIDSGLNGWGGSPTMSFSTVSSRLLFATTSRILASRDRV